MAEEEKEFDPSKTVVQQSVNKAARRRIITWVGGFATVGAGIVALQTFTGLNFRPVWAYELEKVAAAEVRIQQRLESVLKIQDATSRSVLELKQGQLELRLKQIEREKRELRREMAEHQTRAQEFRDRGEPVPGWLRSTIVDTESDLDALEEEKRRATTQLLELEQ